MNGSSWNPELKVGRY